ncbi:hypothetical protein [Pseudomonas corrugata]|uniref:hypothetical protein n=1 Tax=Pseudomonas corrugata TaxID=47879 RepID=UPI001586A393|nr:hypothetical protein [Pseudomonas corrugata]MCI0997740.1 hypothetical protein [Pseudomonas corrugata]NUT64673.1 hypothetical protein [Pseudomonas corrugata]
MTMTNISTARETLARMDKRIAEEKNPRYKKWIQVNRDHWWGEVINDLDMVMGTMSRGPIRYSYDGHPFMQPPAGSLSLINSIEATREMYASILQVPGARAAGPMDNERFMLDDRGMFVYGLLTCVFPGVFITQHSEPIDPEGLYLVRVPNMTMVRFDENDLMQGEDIINGAPQLIKRVDASVVERLIDGPISFD